MALVAESNAQLWSWKRSIVERLADLRLTVHEGSAQVVAVDTGIPWLGFVVYPTYRRVKGRKVVQTTRRLTARFDTRRTGRISLAEFNAGNSGYRWCSLVPAHGR